ncbi:MAG: hypothetical protein ACUVQH_14930, partial [Thermogutta sp.]
CRFVKAEASLRTLRPHAIPRYFNFLTPGRFPTEGEEGKCGLCAFDCASQSCFLIISGIRLEMLFRSHARVDERLFCLTQPEV